MRAVRRNGAALQFASELLRGEVRRSTLDLRHHRFSLTTLPPIFFPPSFFLFLFTGENCQGGHGAVWASSRWRHAAV